MFHSNLERTPRSLSRKLLASIFVLVAAFLLSLRLGVLLDWTPDLILVTLITFAFFLDFFELIFLVALSIFLLMWEPAISLELVLFAAMPIMISLFRKIIFPLEGWLSNIFGMVLGLVIFYGVPLFAAALQGYGVSGSGTGPGIVGFLLRIFTSDLFGGYYFIFGNLALSLCFGFFVFQTFSYFYGEKVS